MIHGDSGLQNGGEGCAPLPEQQNIVLALDDQDRLPRDDRMKDFVPSQKGARREFPQ